MLAKSAHRVGLAHDKRHMHVCALVVFSLTFIVSRTAEPRQQTPHHRLRIEIGSLKVSEWHTQVGAWWVNGCGRSYFSIETDPIFQLTDPIFRLTDPIL